MIRIIKIAICVFAICSSGAFAPWTLAADEPQGMAVIGTGVSKGRPSVVEISAVVSGEGELASDANVKFRDARKKATGALEALNNSSLSIESKGFTVSQAVDPNAQMRMMQGMGSDGGKQKVAVTEQLRIVLRNVDQLELDQLMETVLKVIDVGRDNGLQMGPGNMNYYQMQIAMQSGSGMSMIAFKIPDITTMREEAYKLAVEDARGKAQRLAEIAGVKLGRILAVQDQEVAPPTRSDPAYMYYYMYGMTPPVKDQEAGLISNVFGEMRLTVRLNVQFEIIK